MCSALKRCNHNDWMPLAARFWRLENTYSPYAVKVTRVPTGKPVVVTVTQRQPQRRPPCNIPIRTASRMKPTQNTHNALARKCFPVACTTERTDRDDRHPNPSTSCPIGDRSSARLSSRLNSTATTFTGNCSHETWPNVGFCRYRNDIGRTIRTSRWCCKLYPCRSIDAEECLWSRVRKTGLHELISIRLLFAIFSVVVVGGGTIHTNTAADLAAETRRRPRRSTSTQHSTHTGSCRPTHSDYAQGG